jgi:hypothetical protein
MWGPPSRLVICSCSSSQYETNFIRGGSVFNLRDFATIQFVFLINGLGSLPRKHANLRLETTKGIRSITCGGANRDKRISRSLKTTEFAVQLGPESLRGGHCNRFELALLHNEQKISCHHFPTHSLRH